MTIPWTVISVLRGLWNEQMQEWVWCVLLQYEGDFKEKLNGVREQLNAVAEGWTREDKDRCLQETEKSFAYSGGLLRTITSSD